MKITKRFLFLLFLGTFVVGVSVYLNLFIESFILYNLLLISLAIVDYFITPTKSNFIVERKGDRKLSLLEQEKIQIVVYNKSKYGTFVEVLQEFPGSFVREVDILGGKIPPNSSKEFIWTIKPNKRGNFELEDIYLRQGGRLGLIKKDLLIKNKEEYKVYPSLKNLKKYHLMLRRDSLLLMNNHMVKKNSEGREFESIREYVKGDDIRKVNWIKSARENKLMVNQFQPENNKQIYILLDTGRTMSSRINEYCKLDLAVNACVFLSDVVCHNKDRSGLVIFNTGIEAFIKPSRGDYHRNRVLETLYRVNGTRSTSNYNEVMVYLAKQEKRRSLICMFTDMDTLQETYFFQKEMEHIIKKHYLIIFLMKDEKLKEAVQLELRDKKDVFIKGTAYKMMDERNKIIKSLNKKGVSCIECDKEDIFYKAVNQYMTVKNKEMI